MKEIINFFAGRRYSAVNTCEMQVMDSTVGKNHKSLNHNRPSLNRGLSVLDALFHERKQGKQTRSPTFIFFLLTTGLLLICSGIFILLFHPYDLIFKWKLLLAEDGEIFQLWERPPVDLFLKVYLFNITNHEDFMSGRAKKLNVEEIGPYVYQELMTHENVSFNSNGTLSTIPNHPLLWRGDLSEGRQEDDIFYLPNIALLAIAHVASPKNYFFRLPVNIFVRKENIQPVVKMTAKEFMMGYESPLTTLGNTLLPHWIHFDKVGLIDRMYDFSGDFATYYTGENDIRMSGLYDTFHGSPDLPQWKGEHCSNIQGASDGTKFMSFMQENDTLLFFRKSMCRPQRLKRIGKVDPVQGLEAVKFAFEDNALDNGVHNDLNKCFCRDPNKCLAEGLIDVTDCYYGFPIALSYPHFLDADPALLEGVNGSKPNRSLHESYFVLNPLSGLPLKLSAKFQINMAMSDVRNMAHVEKFSHLTIPMLWFEISMMELPKRLEDRFSLYLNILPVVEKVGLYGSLILGLALSIIAVTQVALRASKYVASPYHQKYHHNLVNNSVYNACEEKVSSRNHSVRNESSQNGNKSTDDVDGEDDSKISDDDDDAHCLNIIRRDDQYELENDDAISDIDYNDDGESSNGSSEQMESDGRSEQSQKFIETDIPETENQGIRDSLVSTVRRLSDGYIEIAQALMGNKRDTLLKIVESDDDES
ncbi:scavenger receptor class B member 1 [Chironomus tepperi]|uniref:scavenger receptor class B member 1 n=1 Tax=Chironomus tepperi TaxID=113505 RepID=UPI00391F3437